MPLGSMPVSRASSSSASSSRSSTPGYYVDNSMNRRLGRVGLPLGTMVVSRSSQGMTTSQKRYVDNSMNRKLGRVGLPLGTMKVSASTSKIRKAFEDLKLYNVSSLYFFGTFGNNHYICFLQQKI